MRTDRTPYHILQMCAALQFDDADATAAALTGYCLDAPELMPAGSHYAFRTAFSRSWPTYAHRNRLEN